MLMSGYTKLFHSILASTVWREDHTTRIVWITLLAMADRHGVAEGSVPGLADFARVTVAECRSALAALMAPDPDSRSVEHEGRRIKAIDGGWQILNHAKYRQRLGADERREYLRQKQADYRRGKKSTNVSNVSDTSTLLTHTEAEAEAEVEVDTEAKKIKNTRLAASLPDGFAEFWLAYPRKTAKADAVKAWQKLRPDANLQRRILDAIGWQSKERQWLVEGGKYIPHPATWLNRGDYDNEPFHGPMVSEHQSKGGRTVAAGQRLQTALDAGAELDPFGTKALARQQAALPAKGIA